MAKIIYRVQKPGDRFGTPHNHNTRGNIWEVSRNPILHNGPEYPSIEEDWPEECFSWMASENYFCACPSMEMVTFWFGRWWKGLYREGFRVLRMEVSDYLMGVSGKQVFFLLGDIVSEEALDTPVLSAHQIFEGENPLSL